MKWLFYSGILLLIIFEAANVYFIMPMPGSQRMDSLAVAYFLFSWRWIFRGLFVVLIILGLKNAWFGSKVLTILFLVLAGLAIRMINFKMAADHMFLPPSQVILQDAKSNVISEDRLVIGVENNDDARAYPIQFLGYHHQVRDTIGGMPIMVTYCTVCRSGRVYQPWVNGHGETFRLVGMDHFNAMFEDRTTKSWWRQENGEAVAGPLKGMSLPEWPCIQTSLRTWLQWHPASLVMQPDSTFKEAYADESDFEAGRLKGKLTLYDTASWHEKSWIAGVIIGDASKAYDWNELKRKKLIQDVIQNQPIIILVSDQNRNLAGFKRIKVEQHFEMKGDTLSDGINTYDLNGHSYQTGVQALSRIAVYQEYWHSWRTFHPTTTR
jgi:hypothetical protein